MSMISAIKKKLYCLKQGHMQQSIDYICNEGDCKEEKLCCYICQQESHRSHHMENIKMILFKIMDINSLDYQSLVNSAAMDATVNEIGNLIQKIRHQITDYDSIVNAFRKYVENYKNKIMNLLEYAEYLENISNLQVKEFQNEFSSFLQKNFKVLLIQQDEKVGRDKNIYNNAIKNIHISLKEILKILEKLQKQDRVNDFQVLSLFSIEKQDGSKAFKPYFSEKYKGDCMKITHNTAQMTSSSSQRVLALEPSLQTGSKVKKWKVKITKLATWIGVGACHLNKLKDATWFFNYSITQHGSYFISSNGYSWSSFKPQFNSKFEPFSFKTGDIISVEYDGRQRKLKFQKDGTPQKYEIEVQSNGDLLHPAINLTGIGDAVEIVS